MQIRTLGKDLKVSAIGLGCMGMSHAYGMEAGEYTMKRFAGLYGMKYAGMAEGVGVVPSGKGNLDG